MPVTVGYCRVSTTKQEDGGLSLKDQKRRLKEAGATTLLVDVMSGAKDHRPQFRELMRLVNAREVDVVLVCKLDRLTRSITARAELYEAFTAPDAPVLKALDDGIDLSTASGRQMFDLMGALATGERERIKERINDGLNARRALGLYVGQTPWGFRLTRTGCGVEIDPQLKPQVEAVLKVMDQEPTLTASAKLIEKELGVIKSRSVWRTWLNSPTLCGSLPHGSKDHGVAHRQYKFITPGAFTSYLTPTEQKQLINKFANAKRGPRSHAPEHPTRSRVFCGSCGKPMQRRCNTKKQLRWVVCSNIFCEMTRKSVGINDSTHALVLAAFHFGRLDLEARLKAQQHTSKNNPKDLRQLELESHIKQLKLMDQSLVGDALKKAERELASKQQQQTVNASLSAINTKRAIEHMEWLASSDLRELDDTSDTSHWERLADLFKIVDVSLTTKQDDHKTFGGKPILVIDQALQHRGTNQEQSLPIAQLPELNPKGGLFEWRDLVAAHRTLKFV